ncbi:hypothetical protein [Caballeronia udeis]|jgi:hypothetical protein|uniref:hypothetical protein n=1 Tax=Caballeronia udeis TaxID=1232866 RepID=UPI00078262AB|nr:hypothetical protein [Caballeronia udeis]
MFELFLARVLAADLTGQIHRRCTTERKAARLMPLVMPLVMPLILRAFSRFVAGCVAPAAVAALTGNAALQAAAS